MKMEIRRIRVGEGALLREVRLNALKESPQAFGSRYEDAVKRADLIQVWLDPQFRGSGRAG